MAYQDLDSIQVPTSGQRAIAAWGGQVNDNFDYVYDEVLAKLGAWTTYTPTILQSATVSKNTTYCRHHKVGRLVHVEFDLAITSSGTANNPISISLPFTAAVANVVIGEIVWYNASVFHRSAAYLASTTTIGGLWDGVATLVGQTTASRPNQLLNTHVLRGHITYESAS